MLYHVHSNVHTIIRGPPERQSPVLLLFIDGPAAIPLRKISFNGIRGDVDPIRGTRNERDTKDD